MSWNYRIIRHPDASEVHGCCYAIHEVFYDDKDNPTSMTENPVGVVSSTVYGLSEVLDMMRKASTLPVLNVEDFKK